MITEIRSPHSVLSKNKPIVFIVGPTAIGKTALALALAEKLKAEIISCDAMQVYKEINIASAKPSAAELKKIKHHAVNLVSVEENFDVVKYRQIALEAIEDILKRGKRPIIVGGSGMYMSVLLDGIFEEPAKDDAIRQDLENQIEIQGTKALHEKLQALDKQAAAKIHFNDAKRIVRALEVVLSTKKPISQLQQKRQGIWDQYPIKIFGLERPREQMYQRAEERIEQMFKDGLVEEMKTVLKKKLSVTAQMLIGLPEISGFLNKAYGLDQAKYLMKLHTRHYIKRQMTWFRRDKRIEWIEIGESSSDIVRKILENV